MTKEPAHKSPRRAARSDSSAAALNKPSATPASKPPGPPPRKKPPGKTISSRLSREDWISAALRCIGEQGLAGVHVAGLAKHLHVTTGSFYWHFASREELIEAALDRWETERIDIIETLRDIPSPRDRIERLILDLYRNRERGALFAALQASASDPRIASRLRRTTQRRLSFLTQTYRELGQPMPMARHSALATYSLYAGLWEVSRTLPPSDEHAVTGPRLTDYVEYLRSLILPPPAK